jgi:hypothetical protein
MRLYEGLSVTIEGWKLKSINYKDDAKEKQGDFIISD